MLAKDIFTTGLPNSAIPPKEAPKGLYDSFQPGDLIYNSIEFAGSNRAHYAVYAGKINGKHSMFDVSPGKIKGEAAAVARVRTLEEGQDEYGTSFAKASKANNDSPSPTAEQLTAIIKQLGGKKFNWDGFESNCESFARAIVNDLPVSTQSQQVTKLTKLITKQVLRAAAPARFYESAFSLKYARQVTRAATARSRTDDAPEGGTGKPCGKSAIPKGKKCHKGAATKVGKFIEKAAPVALGLGLAAGAIALHRRKRPAPPTSNPVPSIPKQPPRTPESFTNRSAQIQAQAEQLGERLNQRSRQNPNPTPVPAPKSAPAKKVEVPDGWRNVVRNEKHNYVMGTHPDTKATLGKSVTPGGNVIDFKLSSSGEVEFRVNGDTNRRQSFSRQEGATILSRVERMLQASVRNLPDNELLWTNAYSNDGLGKKRAKLYERYGFKRDPSDPSSMELAVTVGDLKQRNRRNDAPEGSRGKPCGESFIPKNNKCSKKSASPTNSNLQTTAKVALAAGVLAGGTYLAKHVRNKQRPLTVTERRELPDSARNNQKLTPEQAQKIADEAIAGGQKWDVQEKINARRRAMECGGGLGKIPAPAKFDAAVPNPRCQAGEGAFGTYFVHPSEKYGIKLYRNGDEDDVSWEYDRLDKAHGKGVNVPQPLGMNAVSDEYGDVRAQTLILSHMKGYKTLDSVHPDAYGTAASAPAIVRIKMLREFRKLHTEGLAHGDIHGGNIMVHPRSRKVAIIDFGYSTDINDYSHPVHSRNGVENLMSDLRRLPLMVGYSEVDAKDFTGNRFKGVLDNIETQARDYDSSWEKFEIAVNRYHDALEADLLWGDRMPRSRFVSGADQPRIPGLTRRILTANLSSGHRVAMESFAGKRDLRIFNEQAQKLGVKPPRLFLALKPERDARFARERQKPFGTPLPAPTPKPPKKTPTGMFRFKPGTPTGMRRIQPGVDEFTGAASSWVD